MMVNVEQIFHYLVIGNYSSEIKIRLKNEQRLLSGICF